MNKFVFAVIMPFFMCGIINASSSSEQLVLDSSGKFDHEQIKYLKVPAAVIKTIESCIEFTKNGCSDVCGINIDNLRVFLSKKYFHDKNDYIITMHDGNLYDLPPTDPKSYKFREIRVIEDGHIINDRWEMHIVANREMYSEKKYFYIYLKNGKPHLNKIQANYFAYDEDSSIIDSTERSMVIVPVYKDDGTLDYNKVGISGGGSGEILVYQCPIGCYYQDPDEKDHIELHKWLQGKIDSRKKNVKVANDGQMGMHSEDKTNLKKAEDNNSFLSRMCIFMPMKYIGSAVIIGGTLYGAIKWYKAIFSHKKSVIKRDARSK